MYLGEHPCTADVEEEEGADVAQADVNGVGQEGGATESVCRDRNCASLHFMVAASMAQMWAK